MNKLLNKYNLIKFNKKCSQCNKYFKFDYTCRYENSIMNCLVDHKGNIYHCYYCKKIYYNCKKCDSLAQIISVDNYQSNYDLYQYRTTNIDKIILIIKKYPLLKKYIKNNVLEFNNRVPEIEHYINKYINQDLDFLFDIENNLKLNYDISDLKLNYLSIDNIYLYKQMKIYWKCLNC